MCLLLLTRNHPDYDLILLSNRDEFFARATDVLGQYTIDHSSLSLTVEPSTGPITVLSGRDVERGGTWLALSSTGKFSALTNFHTPERPPPSPISRGHLPLSFLCSTLIPQEYADTLLRDQRLAKVGGFSLLCGDLTSLEDGIVVVGNQSREIVTLLRRDTDVQDKTMHGVLYSQGEAVCACELSNTDVTTPWPKTEMGKKLLDETIQRSTLELWSEETLINQLIHVMSTNTFTSGDTHGMRDSIFIPPLRGYGTRQQTVWLVRGRHVKLIEETIQEDGSRTRKVIEHDL